jgi:hypothetical protein
MAPATVAGVTVRRGTSTGTGARRVEWSRDTIINAIQEWVATYDEPPRAADWNPSSAKWSGQTWRIERYRAGRADGTAWPSLNAAKRPFDGSLAVAVRAAGFEPSKPGPRRRRDVSPAQADRLQMSPAVRVLLDAALAAARDADRRADALDERLGRARERAAALTDERDAARRRSAGADARARAAVEAALRRAEVDLHRSRGDAEAASIAAAEARSRAERLAGRLAELERDGVRLRGERDALLERLDRAIAEAEAQAELVRAARAEAARAATERPDGPAATPGARGAPAPASVAVALREARQDAVDARRAADAAERRAAAAERRLRDRVAGERAGGGGPTPEQTVALREGAAVAAAGPAALGGAIAALARARRSGGGPATRDALWDVARAAVAWRERI